MAAGQAPLGTVFDVPALETAQRLLTAEISVRSASHGRRLRAVLGLHQALSAGGFGLMVVPEIAKVEQTSEHAATELLHQAVLLASLDGALEAVDRGLLTVEQAATLTRQLHGLDPVLQAAVWERAHEALVRAADRRSVLSPARFAELLRRELVRADPADAVTRRKQAEAAGNVDYQLRDDGLGDLHASGINGPVLRAVLHRIRDRARPFGADDTRPVGKRRVDAFLDLLLGRDQLPLDDWQDPFAEDQAQDVPRHCGPSCGCRLGEPVPCGAALNVLVPIGAALGTTDELAELSGHGPLDPALLQDLLHNRPVLRPVWIDPHGTPVDVGDHVLRPDRDPRSVRDALLRLAASTPPRPPEPAHPDDHPDDPDDADDPDHLDQPLQPAPLDTPPPGNRPPQPPPDDGRAVPTISAPAAPLRPPSLSEAALRGPQVLTRPHPTGRPGRYRIPTRLARLIRLRAPRCEWPGCGITAVRCDLDHDRAWPHGPTCGCNLGPLCRRHHRCKQLAATKQRRDGDVLWTDPTGRTWTSPHQHQPPEPAVRPLPALRDPYGPQRQHDDDHDETDGVEPTHSPDPLEADSPRSDPYDELFDDGWGHQLDDPTVWDG